MAYCWMEIPMQVNVLYQKIGGGAYDKNEIHSCHESKDFLQVKKKNTHHALIGSRNTYTEYLMLSPRPCITCLVFISHSLSLSFAKLFIHQTEHFICTDSNIIIIFSINTKHEARVRRICAHKINILLVLFISTIYYHQATTGARRCVCD